MKRVVIFRGPSGCGKSTEALKYVRSTSVHDRAIVSADDYFMVKSTSDQGHEYSDYRFDASKLGDAHAYCMRQFLCHIRNEIDVIVVDNTATTIAEVTPYRLVALACGYDVEVIHILGDAETCARRNTHGVPLSTIQNMISRFEMMPAFLGGERIIDNRVQKAEHHSCGPGCQKHFGPF